MYQQIQRKAIQLEPLLGNSVIHIGRKNPSLYHSTVARMKEKHRFMFLKTAAQIIQQARARTLHRGGQSSGNVLAKDVQVVHTHNRLMANSVSEHFYK